MSSTLFDNQRRTAARPVDIGFRGYLYRYLDTYTPYLHPFTFSPFSTCVYPVENVENVEMRTVRAFGQHLAEGWS